MKLYCPVSLEMFIKGTDNTNVSKEFCLHLHNRLSDKYTQEYTYGLSLLRQALQKYEKNKGIAHEESKSEIPFFRNNLSLLVGPEMQLYASGLYETMEVVNKDFPDLILTLDYEKLGEHCIFENLFLMKCKYNEEQNILFFEKQLEREYEKFFYDEEYTGFTSDSRFFSMLCNACLEIREPKYAEGKEWQIASLQMPENAFYQYSNGILESYFTTNIPIKIIERISMPDYRNRRDEYTALAGLLKQIGLNPEDLLEGYE